MWNHYSRKYVNGIQIATKFQDLLWDPLGDMQLFYHSVKIALVAAKIMCVVAVILASEEAKICLSKVKK